MKRFFWWILLFFVLLITIPAMAYFELFAMAKILGIITVVTLSIALWVWKNQSARLNGTKNRIKLNLNDRFWLNQHCPFYGALSKEDKIVFTDRMGLFLGKTRIYSEQNIELTKENYFVISSSFVISTWNEPFDLRIIPDEVHISNSDTEQEISENLKFDNLNFDAVNAHSKSLYPSTVIENNPWLTKF